MQRAPRSSRSVRGIIATVLAALALLCLAVAAGVAWVSATLQSTSAALVRDTESLRLVTQMESQLLDYQRLAVFQDDPVAVAQRGEVRRDLARSLDEAMARAGDAAEVALIERIRTSIDAYIAARSRLEEEGRGPLQIQQEARALMNAVLAELDLLLDMNRAEVGEAYGRAQQVGAFFIVAAALTAGLTAALLLIAAWAIDRSLLRPILGLRETIDRFRAGEPGARADERAPRELSEIARAFNEMSAELQRQKAQQLAFIAGVAHDLRTPLTALRYGVDAIRAQSGVEMSEPIRKTLVVLGRQLDHLARMADDLMETCVGESDQLMLDRTVFDLREAVSAVVDLYRALASGHALTVELGPDALPVDADRIRVEQVVGNLLSNAIKYSPDQSLITIEVARAGDMVQLLVADQGVGIDPADHEDIFRPFWRSGDVTAQRGTGLGLSVVRRIVTAHGGTIRVDSAKGTGAAFIVTLPIAGPEREAG